jgi:hypothetical protein
LPPLRLLDDRHSARHTQIVVRVSYACTGGRFRVHAAAPGGAERARAHRELPPEQGRGRRSEASSWLLSAAHRRALG